MTQLLAWMRQVAHRAGMDGPVMLSACRSREEQASLQQQWDRGNQAGLAVRPVSDSKHIPDEFGICRAFDLANSVAWLEAMGRVVSMQWGLSVEWGGTYLPPDPRHFEER